LAIQNPGCMGCPKQFTWPGMAIDLATLPQFLTLDSNQDGVIDAADARFGGLRVWRDLNQNGVSDAGELQTLGEVGIASINLTRTDVPGTLLGHGRGFASTFTRANGTTGTVETIYFQTDRQQTADPVFKARAGAHRGSRIAVVSGGISAITRRDVGCPGRGEAIPKLSHHGRDPTGSALNLRHSHVSHPRPDNPVRPAQNAP
jgi:hypothetical protein